MDGACNLRCCVRHKYIIKHELASPQCSFIAYLCLWLQCASETGDMLVCYLDWFHCHSPALCLIWQPPSEPRKHFFFPKPEGGWGVCINQRLHIRHWQKERAEFWGLFRACRFKNTRAILQVHNVTKDSRQITHANQDAWRLAEFGQQFLFHRSLLDFSWEPTGRCWIWLLMNQDTLYWS